MQKRRPVMGCARRLGWREDVAANAVRRSEDPHLRPALGDLPPRRFLRTYGNDVGMPTGQMAIRKSAISYMARDRVVMQDLPRIDDAIASGEIAKAPAVTGLIAK